MNTTRLLLASLLACTAAATAFEREARADLNVSRSDTFCYDTTQPQVILQNDVAALYWSSNGDLSLVNTGGAGLSTTSWGIGSPVPLTDPSSNTATVCYGTGGNLKIKDHAGNVVWASSTNSTSDSNVLVLDQCTVKARHTAGTKWSLSTSECSESQHGTNGGAGWCMARPTSANVKIAWDVDAGVELDWQTDGNLVFYATAGQVPYWASNTGGNVGSQLCFSNDGDLTVNKADGSVAFTSGTGYLISPVIAVDACGVSVKDANGITYWRQGSRMCAGASMPPNMQSIAFASRGYGGFVSAENGGASALTDNRTVVGPWEGFEFVNLGGGNVALKALINGKYVTNPGPDAQLIASSTSVGPAETFQWISLPSGDFALMSGGRYVIPAAGGLVAAGAWISALGTFHWEPTPVVSSATTGPVSILSRSNGRYVTAENAGTSALIANRTAVGMWEEFQIVDVGGGNVALRSLTNGNYVTADNDGASALIANRTAVGPWETFGWVDLGNNDFALRAVNGQYVSAENGGANPLLADRTAIGTWETFNWAPASDTPVNAVTGGGYSFVYDKSFGDGDFGAEMWLVSAATDANALANLRAAVPTGSAAANALNGMLPSGTVPSTFAEVLGTAGASATLFGQNLTVLEVDAYVGYNNALANGLDVTAAGLSIYNGSVSASTTYSYTLEKTFLEEEEQLMIGPIPVTLHADVTGSIGVTETLTATATTSPPVASLSAVTTPNINLTVNGSVGIGCDIASAGVEGSLTLLDMSAPLTLGYATNQTYNAQGELDISTLNGSLDVYAKVDLGFYSKKWSRDVASWNGYSFDKVLFATARSF